MLTTCFLVGAVCDVWKDTSETDSQSAFRHAGAFPFETPPGFVRRSEKTSASRVDGTFGNVRSSYSHPRRGTQQSPKSPWLLPCNSVDSLFECLLSQSSGFAG